MPPRGGPDASIPGSGGSAVRGQDGTGGPAVRGQDGPAARALTSVERFGAVGSTNDIVRDWLAAGRAEGCVAVADAQTAGRGRLGRTWADAPGRSLLCSIGFRPTWLELDAAWRLPAIVALAMADAAEDVAGLRDGTVRLKWPNDLAIVEGDGLRKLAGILTETDGLGGPDPQVVVGIGLNADWPAADFPVELATTMTSLQVVSGGRPIDRERLLGEFLARLEVRLMALRSGWFDVGSWIARQATTGHTVVLDLGDGTSETVRAVGVDSRSGALVVVEQGSAEERHVVAGEVRHVRLADAPAGRLPLVGV